MYGKYWLRESNNSKITVWLLVEFPKIKKILQICASLSLIINKLLIKKSAKQITSIIISTLCLNILGIIFTPIYSIPLDYLINAIMQLTVSFVCFSLITIMMYCICISSHSTFKNLFKKINQTNLHNFLSLGNWHIEFIDCFVTATLIVKYF